MKRGARIHTYNMPYMTGAPLLNSYPSEFMMNEILIDSSPYGPQPQLTGDERLRFLQVKRELLMDSSHVFGMEAQRTQLENWNIAMWVSSGSYDLPLKTVEGFSERQAMALLSMYQDNLTAEDVHAQKKEIVRPQSGITDYFKDRQYCTEPPYAMRTQRLHLPSLIETDNPDVTQSQLNYHFAPVEARYNYTALHRLEESVIGREGVKSCFRIKHPLEFIAVHAPQTFRGQPQIPDRHLVFAMLPFDARLIAGTRTAEAACNLLEILDHTYILPHYSTYSQDVRKETPNTLHYSNWQLQARHHVKSLVAN